MEDGFGAATVTTLEADDVGHALGRLATSDLPFDIWFRETALALHGIGVAPGGSEAFPKPFAAGVEVLFDWLMPGEPDSAGRAVARRRPPFGPD